MREFQEAQAVIRVAADILLERACINSQDIKHIFLRGSFGGRLNFAAFAMGVLPGVDRVRIELLPNGAGLGAALFLQDSGFAMGEEFAERANHVELDLDPAFNRRFVAAMGLETAYRKIAERH